MIKLTISHPEQSPMIFESKEELSVIQEAQKYLDTVLLEKVNVTLELNKSFVGIQKSEVIKIALNPHKEKLGDVVSQVRQHQSKSSVFIA